MAFIQVFVTAAGRAESALSPGAGLLDVHHEWTWSLEGSATGSRGLWPLQLDGDDGFEILLSGRSGSASPAFGFHWHQVEQASEFRQTWSSLPAEKSIVRIFPFYVAENQFIAVANRNDIAVFDASSKALVREVLNLGVSIETFLIGDTDGDNDLEIALCDYSGFRILDFQTLEEEFAIDGEFCSSLEAANADGDAALEILLVGSGGDRVVDGSTFEVQWSSESELEGSSRFVDLEGDDVAELLYVMASWQTLSALDLATLRPRWDAPLGCTAAAVALKTFEEGSDSFVLAACDYTGDGLRAVRTDTGELAWSVPLAYDMAWSLAVADVDGDGVEEGLLAVDDYEGGDQLLLVDLEKRLLREALGGDTGPISGISLNTAGVPGPAKLVLATRSVGNFGFGRILELVPNTGAARWIAQDLSSNEHPGNQASLTAQLDSDPQLEVCVGGNLLVYCADSATEEPHWILHLPWESDVSSLRQHDLDGDGANELLIGTRGGFVYAVEGATGWLRWRSPRISTSLAVESVQFADIDGYPGDEIVAVTDWWISPDGVVLILEPGTGALLWSSDQAAPIASVLPTQLDSDPASELLVGSTYGEVSELDLTTGWPGIALATFSEAVHDFLLHDVNGDGTRDLLAWSGTRLELRDGISNDALWTSPYLAEPWGKEPLLVAQIDEDPAREVAALFEEGVAIFELPVVQLFADGFESGDTDSWSWSVP